MDMDVDVGMDMDVDAMVESWGSVISLLGRWEPAVSLPFGIRRKKYGRTR